MILIFSLVNSHYNSIKKQTSMSCLFSPKCLIRIQYWSRLGYPADKGLMLIHDTHKPTELAQKKTIALIWVMSTSILVPACVLNFLFVWFSKWVAFLKRLHLNWINKKCKEGGKLRRQIILLKRRQQFKPRGKKVLFFFLKKRSWN